MARGTRFLNCTCGSWVVGISFSAFVITASFSGTIYAFMSSVQVGLPVSSGSVPNFDAALLFIVGWVGGDSGRHSPGRLYCPQGDADFPSDSSNASWLTY